MDVPPSIFVDKGLEPVAMRADERVDAVVVVELRVKVVVVVMMV